MTRVSLVNAKDCPCGRRTVGGKVKASRWVVTCPDANCPCRINPGVGKTQKEAEENWNKQVNEYDAARKRR